MKTYKIVRYKQHEPNEVLRTGVTLEEAQAHCQRADTRGDGWFDGYTVDMTWSTVEFKRRGHANVGAVTVSDDDAGMVAAQAGDNGFTTTIRPATEDEVEEALSREP
jgi:hypothetical protein